MMMKKQFIFLWITIALLLLPTSLLAYGGGSTLTIHIPETNQESLIINSGLQNTTSTAINLDLSAVDAKYMAISNTPDFLNISWELYATSKEWVLTTDEGEKTVYVKFKSSSGGVTSVISKTINLGSQILSNKPDMNSDGVVDDFDFSILMSNWGTPTNVASDLNSDGAVDDFDFSILMSNWT